MRKEKENKKRRKLLPAMLAVALAAVMIVPMGNTMAKAAEGDGGKDSYSLTVKASASDEMVNDLSTIDTMRIDVYKVASGEKDKSYETWHWTMTGDYAGLTYDEKNFTNEDFTKLALDAANIALKDGEEKEADVSATAKDAVAKLTLSDPGLYIVIPRDNGETAGADIDRDANGNVVTTTVETTDYRYTYSPSIVAVPGKNTENPGDPIGTAQSFGDWTNNVEMVLKPSQTENVGSITVSKSLNEYENSASATFAFSVVATKKDVPVYDNVVSITFTKDNPNPEPYQIDNIPVGSTVTVKEIYAPPSYDLIENPVEVTVKSDTIENAAFSNEYDGTRYSGGGIENQYAREKNEDGTDGSWKLIGRIINGIIETLSGTDQAEQ